MKIDYDELFKRDVFKSIEPERIAVFKEFVKKANGKSMNEIVDIIIEFEQKMPQGKSLSENEKKAIFETMFEILPEGEKKQFKMLVKMAETFQ